MINRKKVLMALVAALLVTPVMGSVSVKAAATEPATVAAAADEAEVSQGVVIDIPDECLRGAILDKLGKDDSYAITKADMESIEYLDASNRRISSIEGLEYCKNLHMLRLEQNRIEDLHPIRLLKNLNLLWLYGNRITSISSVKSLTNLTALNVSLNDISDLTPLTKLSKLEVFYASNNNISNIATLANLTNLEEVNLDYNYEISDISPLANLTNLTIVNLAKNKVSDVSALKNLTKLQMLYLGENKITDISPLKNLTNLNKLELQNQYITLPKTTTTGTVDYVNPAKSLDGSAITTLSKINCKGVYNEAANTLSWTGLEGNLNLSYCFSQPVKLGTASTTFNGKISMPAQFTK